MDTPVKPEKTIQQYAHETSFHGIPQIVGSQSWVMRIFWISMFGTAVGLLVYEINKIVVQYRDTPYATQVKIMELRSFPLVGFCPADSVDPRKAVDSGLTQNHLNAMYGVLPNIFSDYVDKEFTASDSVVEDIERLRNGYPSYSDMLKNYSIDLHENMDIECDLCTEEKPQIIKYVKSTGVCYIINAGKVKPIAERGSRVPQLRISYRESEQAKYSKDIAQSLLQQPATSYYPTASSIGSGSGSGTTWGMSGSGDTTTWGTDITSTTGYESSTSWLKRKKRDHDGSGSGSGYYYSGDYGTQDYSYYSSGSGYLWSSGSGSSYGWEGGGIEIEYQEMPSFRLMFGDQAKKFDEFGDVKLEVGKDATVLVSIIRKTLYYEKGRCLDDDKLTGSEYTPCIESCMNSVMKETCNRSCYDYLGEIEESALSNLEGKDRNATFCRPGWSQYMDYTTAEEVTCRKTARKECQKICIGPCGYFLYEPSIMPTQSKAMEDQSNSMDIIVRPLHPESLLWLAEVPTYTWDTFLSNIGGMLGLFCGASLLSVVHVFYFCIATCCRKRKSANM